MAYNLSQRFPLPPPYQRITDPGAFQKVSTPLIKINKTPFLSTAVRHTTPKNNLWCHNIYNTDTPAKIVNCAVLKSKVPRFPYEHLSQEDIEKLLCQCGIQSCECPLGEHEQEDIICQGKVSRRLYKGPVPKSDQSSFEKKEPPQPPFYNTRVMEYTSFYKGCKWSRWTSKRSTNYVEMRPGPADYTIEKEPNSESICYEEIRFLKRKTSKQLRFIEMVQRNNIREGLPGPATYSPNKLKGTDLNYLGPKADRFMTKKYDKAPGPADHWVKRDFELPETPNKMCQAQLPERAPFGVKDKRLKYKFKEGPSPASYDVKAGTCKIMKCSRVPFGSSTVRFKDSLCSSDEEDYDEETDKELTQSESNLPTNDPTKCELPSWLFRSKTIRLKPLSKRYNEPSPADLPQSNNKILRSAQLQDAAPFNTSDERFRAWYNWIPVHGKEKTPGPCYYCLEIPKCLPAVLRGPLSRCPRFKTEMSGTPSPNKYKVPGGIEDILATHNERLKTNIDQQHKSLQKKQISKGLKILSCEEKEEILLNECIELLNISL